MIPYFSLARIKKKQERFVPPPAPIMPVVSVSNQPQPVQQQQSEEQVFPENMLPINHYINPWGSVVIELSSDSRAFLRNIKDIIQFVKLRMFRLDDEDQLWVPSLVSDNLNITAKDILESEDRKRQIRSPDTTVNMLNRQPTELLYTIYDTKRTRYRIREKLDPRFSDKSPIQAAFGGGFLVLQIELKNPNNEWETFVLREEEWFYPKENLKQIYQWTDFFAIDPKILWDSYEYVAPDTLRQDRILNLMQLWQIIAEEHPNYWIEWQAIIPNFWDKALTLIENSWTDYEDLVWDTSTPTFIRNAGLSEHFTTEFNVVQDDTK